MCLDPLTIAGAALSGASLLANQQAANSVQKARDGALGAERIRQRGLDQESASINEGSRARYDGFQGKQDERGGKLADYFRETTDAGIPAEPGVSAPAGNVLVQQEIANQRGKAAAFNDQQAGALGNLRSFGDLLGETSRLQARDAGQVGTVNNFKIGSSGVLPAELEAANARGGNARLLGDLFRLGGTVATASGLSGGGPSWGELAGSTSAAPGRAGFAMPNVRA